jgi:hypothetical protein
MLGFIALVTLLAVVGAVLSVVDSNFIPWIKIFDIKNPIEPTIIK